MILAGADRDLLLSRVRVVPDWPKPGVAFQDLSGVLADPAALGLAVRALAGAADAFDVVVGIEARGFPYGTAIAYASGSGFVAMRKPGKLPGAVHAQAYELEYGTETLELHADAVTGRRALIVDDVLATGGTAAAAIDLVRRSGGEAVALAVVMEIPALGGRAVIEGRGVPVLALTDPAAQAS